MGLLQWLGDQNGLKKVAEAMSVPLCHGEQSANKEFPRFLPKVRTPLKCSELCKSLTEKYQR